MNRSVSTDQTAGPAEAAAISAPAARRRLSLKKKLLFSALVPPVFVVVLQIVAMITEVFLPSACGRRLALPPRTADTARIFVYGGSTANGYPSEHMGFASRLQAELTRPPLGRQVVVSNFASPGQDSAFARRSMEQTIGENPDLLIVMTGHNEFLRETTETALQRVAHRFALYRVFIRLKTETHGYMIARGRAESEQIPPIEYDRDSEVFARKIRHFESNVRSMIRMAADREIPLFLLTLPSNLSDWEPVRRGFARNDFDETYNTELAAFAGRAASASSPDEALAVMRGFLEMYPDDATALYAMGKYEQQFGRGAEALELLTEARDLDPVPIRALSGQSEFIRSRSTEAGVRVIDIEREFAARSPDGITGFDLVADNVHPTAAGYALIIRGMMDVMKAEGILLGPHDRLPSEREIMEDIYGDYPVLDGGERGLRTLELLAHANTHVRSPFFHLSAAEMYAERALGINPTDWRTQATAAVVDLMHKRIDEGVARLVSARTLKGSPLPRQDIDIFLNITDALISRGVSVDDLVARGILEAQ